VFALPCIHQYISRSQVKQNMVQTRSGARVPSTTPRVDDPDQIPDQIVVNTQGQPQENQSSRIAEPSQTPRQTPQVYLAGTIPSRLTLERSPSAPRHFRPSEFVFSCHSWILSLQESHQSHQEMILNTREKHLRKQELINYCHQETSYFKHL
jgi:hypothetical protein